MHDTVRPSEVAVHERAWAGLREAGTCPMGSRTKASPDELAILTRVVEHFPGTVMITDRDGVIKYVNRAFEDTFGFSREEAIGRQPSLLKSGEHDDAVYRHLWSTVLRGQVYCGELINRCKSGRLYRERKTIVPVTDAQGRVAQFVGIGGDATEDDASETKSLEQKLQQSESTRRELSAQLLSALEAERRRIAAELHDGIGQVLTSIKMRVETALSLMKAGQTTNGEEMLANLVPMIQQTMDEVRDISMALRPPMLDDLGIVATAGWFCRNFASTCPGIRVEQDVRIRERDVAQHLKIVIYRVLQEAMNNVARHAHAEFVRVRLSRLRSDIELVVEDNGCGFDLASAMARDASQRGTGITNMRERLGVVGGHLSVHSTSRIGTVVRAVMPGNAESAQRQ
jgi:PAS domain S-box-containing protein